MTERFYENDLEYRGDKFFNFHSALAHLDEIVGDAEGWYPEEIQRREQSVLDDVMEEVYREGEYATCFEVKPSETLSGNPKDIDFSVVRTYAPEDKYEENPIYEITFK